MRVGQPIDQIAYEFLRGLVNPVKVLNSKNKGLLSTLPNEQVPDGLKGSQFFLCGFKLQICFIIHLEREKISWKGGKRLLSLSSSWRIFSSIFFLDDKLLISLL